MQDVSNRLNRARGKSSLSTFLRKSLKLTGGKFSLLREFGFPFPEGQYKFAKLIKNLSIQVEVWYPLDYAISTRGGVSLEAVDSKLMLRELPGIFCAGEMLDWDAPTEGYLLTGCL